MSGHGDWALWPVRLDRNDGFGSILYSLLDGVRATAADNSVYSGQ